MMKCLYNVCGPLYAELMAERNHVSSVPAVVSINNEESKSLRDVVDTWEAVRSLNIADISYKHEHMTLICSLQPKLGANAFDLSKSSLL